MDLNALADFTLVASSGGLGKASRASGKSKATLSRRIVDLEEQLGVRLIERSARGLKLTDAGAVLMARTEGPMLEVAEAMTATREGLSTPRGLLRVASPVLFSQLAMGRLSAEFSAAFPEVTVEVTAEDRLVDLVEEQFDVAIRINPKPDSNLVGRCFAKDRLVVWLRRLYRCQAPARSGQCPPSCPRVFNPRIGTSMKDAWSWNPSPS